MGRAHTGKLDGSLVYVNGLLEDRTADGMTVDGGFVYVNSLLEDRTADRWGLNECFVDTNGLLVRRRPMVVGVVNVTVVMAIVVLTILNDSLGHTNVLAVTRLITSTVFTLDFINGSVVVLLGDYGLGTVLVMMVVSVGVNFNTSVRIRRASGSEEVIMLAIVFLFASEAVACRVPAPGFKKSKAECGVDLARGGEGEWWKTLQRRKQMGIG